MPVDTSWMDALPAAQPTSGMLASGMAAAQKETPDGIPTMTVKPASGGKPADTGWMDGLPEAMPTTGMLLAQGKQAGGASPGKGVLANAAAGANKSIFGALGAPVDLATGAINLVPRGINAATGSQIPTIQNPVGGSQWLGQQFGKISTDPNTVEPTNEAERIAQGVGGAVAQVPMMALGGAAAGATGIGGVPGSVANALRSSGGSSIPSAALTAGAAGAGGGVGQAAEDAVPDAAKPYANLAGNLAGAGGVVAAARGAQAAGGLIARKAGEMGIGSKQDFNGVRATAAQANKTGNTIAEQVGPAGRQNIERATDAEQQAQAVQRVLDDPATSPAERTTAQQQLNDLQGRRVSIVPGSNPTTAQVAQTAGAAGLEKQARLTHGPQFEEAAKQQNNARVGAIQGLEPTGANPASPGELFAQHLNTLDQTGQAQIGQASGARDTLVQASGGTAPTADYGGQMREMLQNAAEPVHAAASRAFRAVDPDGSWTIQAAPLKDVASKLALDVSPTANSDAQTAALLARGMSQPRVIPFSSLSQMRADANDAIARLMRTGTAPSEVRRLTLFKQGIDQTISKAVDDRAQVDPSLIDRIIGQVDAHQQGAVPGDGNVAPGSSGTGVSAGVSGNLGGAGAGPGRSGSAGSNGPLAVPAANGRGPARPQSLVDWIIARGGIRDDTGDLKAIGADTIHHQQGGRLINPRGMSLNHAIEGLTAEGFMSPDTGRGPNMRGDNDLVNLIGEHVSGRPTYRAGDMAQAEEHRLGGAGAANAEALYDARDRVNTFADQGNIPLSATERDHAAQLVAMGAHPEEALRQATAATEERALGQNAQRGAFSGRLGVPAGAQQGEMGVEGHGPPLIPNVGAEEAGRYQNAVSKWRDYKQQFGQGGVGDVLKKGDQGFKVAEGNVPSKIFTGGPTEPAQVQHFIEAVGGADNAAELGRNVLANDLRTKGIIKPDGTVDANRLSMWNRNRQATLSQFPGLPEHFASVEAAQRTVNDLTAAHKAAIDEFNKSAAAHWIRDDPLKAVGKAFASGNPAETFQRLAAAVHGAPAAEAGMKRAVVDYITQRFRSATPSSDGIDFLQPGGFRKWVDTNKAPLRILFGGQGMRDLQMVAADMRRAAEGPKAIAGSQTTPLIANAKRLGHAVSGHGGQGTLLTMMTILGEHLGEHLGGHGVIAAGASLGSGLVFNALRQSGIHTMEQLTAEAMLHPQLARELMARVDAKEAASEAAQHRIATALQGALLADMASTGEKRQ
jgi:hypothetical protein